MARLNRHQAARWGNCSAGVPSGWHRVASRRIWYWVKRLGGDSETPGGIPGRLFRANFFCLGDTEMPKLYIYIIDFVRLSSYYVFLFF